METIESIDNQPSLKQQRPSFLTVLCILTFIATGWGVMTGFLGLFSAAPTDEIIQAQQLKIIILADELRTANVEYLAGVIDQFGLMQTEIFQNFKLHVLITLFVSLIGLGGSLLMFKGKKLGFHLYIIYSILSVISIYAVASSSNISSFHIITNISVSGIFILMYSRNLKWLK
jgi:hypothetical protein